MKRKEIVIQRDIKDCGPCCLLSIIRHYNGNVPLEKILVETDCPYLAPQLYRGTRNEPSYVVEVAKKIAEIKVLPFEEVCKITTNNTIKLYNLEKWQVIRLWGYRVMGCFLVVLSSSFVVKPINL